MLFRSDLPKIIARKQKVVRKLVLGVKGKLTAHGVTIVSGEALRGFLRVSVFCLA